MKKLSYAVLVVLMSVSLPSDAAEKQTVQVSNILCDFFGIGCSVVTTSDSDGDGSGKEPPKQG